ncbi:MAG TPA: S4 domain-containing protein YaaA [Thermoclostridium caenicola]|uniref:S4 domain protein YaaA n=1 Tax=Thermoclostridium caenicola TaxID=659425 RepID=A0A1M6JAK7_9FIRM|nr:S4 domain-containing protein YaaA [Thermoclostridium caenicola]SHJ43682.1 S4 domain protein YaaA [Thermoclostridium caenicola]HOK42533.1 S4 domain-containing protein YaaA [Thermoclostridium caenicola]HOL84261.1 S4 domain-containing protein YaaA [Thermoclostridium caenicola]HPO76439.1 S4 domain-containing protein YaaA [Thermoclostridium caenicola]
MKRITITTDYIKLDQFLKLTQIIATGGEAKQFIQDHDIFVNGEPEKRRGRKLRHLDQVQIGQDVYVIEQAGVES